MKVINSKLAAIGLAAFVFASCSDSTSETGGGNTPLPTITPEITKVGLVQTDAAQLAASVTNYKHSSTSNARTRAIDASLFNGLTSMPEVPASDNAKRLNNVTNLTGGEWKTVGEKSYDFTGKTINNTTLFISGGTTVTYDQLGSGNTIYVKAGGTLNFTGTGTAIPTGNTIVVVDGATYSCATPSTIIIDGKLYSSNLLGETTGEDKTNPKLDQYPVQDITINGDVYLSGYTNKKTNKYVRASLRAKKLTINKGARVNTEDRVTFTNEVELSGALHVGNTCIVNKMTINDGGDFSTDASTKVKESLTMNPGSKMSVIYLNVTDNQYDKETLTEKTVKTAGESTLTLKGNAQITIGTHGVINVNRLFTDNTAGQFIVAGEKDNVAVVKVDQFVYDGTGEINCFSTPNTEGQLFLLQLIECYQNGAISDANKIDYENGETWEASATCKDYVEVTGGGALGKLEPTEGFGYVLKGNYEIGKQLKLDLLAKIENADADGQSATCILPHTNGKIYISYHTRGDEFGGNIEVAHIDGNQLSVDQNVKQAIPTLDFNHLNVIDNMLYLAGSGAGKQAAKIGGATLSYVGFNGDGTLNIDGGMQSLALDNTTAGDANCVVKYGSNIVVANTKGYDLIDSNYNDDPIEAPGKAKFVVNSGNNLIGLNYTEPTKANEDPVNGQIQIFNTSNLSSSTSFNVGQIAPNNGKNMIAVDNNGRIYVCKSAKGLTCYENGSEVWSWLTPVSKSDKNQSVDKRQGYVNGVAVDNKYVYVAAGAYGLVVLDKDGNEVAKKRVGKDITKSDYASANYVAVKDDLIYVAYGQGRVQIFKLIEPTTNQQ